MRIEHVIYLSSAGCALWSWRRTEFVEHPVRTPVGADPGPIVQELARLPAAPVAILVDMTDEEHLRDTVARLGRRDQQALLERKLARAFPRTAFRTALVQGRSASNPDEDAVLLSALTRPEPLRVLMQRLTDARIPVAGVLSPALLTGRLLDADARSAPAAMLVLRRGNGRLQHSFFREGKLAGSRRLRAVSAPAPEDPALMLRQLEESLRYFDATFAVSAESPLQVLLAADDLDLLGTATTRGDGWHLRQLDVAELSKRLGIAVDVSAAETERVFIEVLRRHAGTVNFAPPPERRYFELFRARSFARVACLALAGAALAGTFYNALFILEAGQQLVDSSATVDRLESVLPETGTPHAKVDPLEMQQAVTAYDALASHQTEPGEILEAIGAAVSERPRIRLDSILWTTGAPDGPEPVVDASEDSGSSDGAVAAAPADGVTVTLKGRVEPFRGDFPLAFAELQAFVEALEEDPAVESVTPRVRPLDVDPRSTLSGELARGKAEEQAPFTLEIALKPGHEPADAGLAMGNADDHG